MRTFISLLLFTVGLLGCGPRQAVAPASHFDEEDVCGLQVALEQDPRCNLDAEGRRLVASTDICRVTSDCGWVGSPQCPSRCGHAGQVVTEPMLCNRGSREADRRCLCVDSHCTMSIGGIEYKQRLDAKVSATPAASK